MLKNITNEQFKRLAIHSAAVNNVLLEAFFPDDEPDLSKEPALNGLLPGDIPLEPLEEERPDFDNLPDFEPFNHPPVPLDWQGEERIRRERDMNRLCGRWTMGKNRCGIEISRSGEHYVLTYLKRNGSPSDERYVLLWIDGDVLYYGYEQRLVLLALNTENDTLMVSPGNDYTRWGISEM